MITIVSPTTGKPREIPETITRDGTVYTYKYTTKQANYRHETDWYSQSTDGFAPATIRRQQPFILTNSSIGT